MLQPNARLIRIVLLLPFTIAAQGSAQNRGLDPALAAGPSPGQTFTNIFSRTTTYKTEGFDEVIQQVSGNATYMVKTATRQKLVFAGQFHVESKTGYSGDVEYRGNGRTVCYDGSCELNNQASGLLFNSFLWGVPPRKLRQGLKWNVMIDQPWELGPPGKQTVTVILMDPANHWIVLKREGSGEGRFSQDPQQVQITKAGTTYMVSMTPHKSHWAGYTTFHQGIIVSDELLVTREVTLSSAELGNLSATQQRYILLNAMPPGTF
jgi:hypothetical protein